MVHLPKQLDPVAAVDAHVSGGVLACCHICLAVCILLHRNPSTAQHAQPTHARNTRMQIEALKKQRRAAAMELLNKRHGRMGKGADAAAGGGGGEEAVAGDGGGGGGS